MTIKPMYQWKDSFQAIASSDQEHYEHNGKKFTVLEDKTDEAIRNDEEYGYARCYRIEFEDGLQIDALEVEVEDFPE